MDEDWDQHHRTVRHRLSWAPLLANGVLIATLVGGAAQADDPQAALRSFTVALGLFGLGAAAGLLAEEIALKADQEWKGGTAWWEDPAGPVKLLVPIPAKINELTALHARTADQTAELLRLLAEGKRLGEKAMAEGPASQVRVKLSIRLNRRAAWARGVSLGLCALGFCWMLVASQIA